MRAALLAALIALPAFAQADSKTVKQFPKLGVYKDRVKNADGPKVSSFTSVSHVLYLNDCKPNGCVVKPGGQTGTDDSRTNTSSINEGPGNRTLSAFPYGYWDELVACVQDTFAPFDIQITTTDPGTASHFEVMVGGLVSQISNEPTLSGAGGVAPFIDCSTTQDNVISFVFAQSVNDLNFLCGAVAQEAAHVWGLDHVLDADDPMTYLDLGSSKRFQNRSAQCGEYEAGTMPGLDGPRSCFCAGTTNHQSQNGFAFLSGTFDQTNLGPATATITQPIEGAYVRPGFPIKAELDSQVQFASGQLAVDGMVVGSIDDDPVAISAPAAITAGDHKITVTLKDTAQRSVADSVNVHVLAQCAAGCAAGFACLDNLCVPGANVAGGLGATCDGNDDCITGTCASDGTTSQCTGACGAAGCPSGFECLGDAQICWPESDGGGCSTGGNPAGFLLIGLGFGVVLLRRRRRN